MKNMSDTATTFEPPLTEPVLTRRAILVNWARTHPVRTVALTLVIALVLSQALAAFWVLADMKYHNPKDSAFMRVDPAGATYQWVDGDNVSRNFLVALIAHEDAPFPDRLGPVTFKQMWARASAYLGNRPDPSGSTIDQQLAKNMFLSSDRSMWRKAEEVDMAAVSDFLLDKHRRLELYANVAQMGPGIYGVCAASWYYFNEDPAKLTLDQSAQIVGLLPEPVLHPRAKAGGVVYRAPTKARIGDTVAWTRAHLPTQVAGVNGLEAVIKVGYYGYATTHVGGVKCNLMPVAVRAKLVKEGFLPPAKPLTPAPASVPARPGLDSAVVTTAAFVGRAKATRPVSVRLVSRPVVVRAAAHRPSVRVIIVHVCP